MRNDPIDDLLDAYVKQYATARFRIDRLDEKMERLFYASADVRRYVAYQQALKNALRSHRSSADGIAGIVVSDRRKK